MSLRQLILYPDAEQTVVKYLRAQLGVRAESYAQKVSVGTRMPTAVPGRYVLIRRAGGTNVGVVVDAPRLDVMVWHDDDFQRVALAQLARGILLATVGQVANGVPVYRVTEFVGPINMPDPANEDRTVTMFTVEMRLRGAAA